MWHFKQLSFILVTGQKFVAKVAYRVGGRKGAGRCEMWNGRGNCDECYDLPDQLENFIHPAVLSQANWQNAGTGTGISNFFFKVLLQEGSHFLDRCVVVCVCVDRVGICQEF